MTCVLYLFFFFVERPFAAGPLGPKQWQSALLWHNEEQRLLATASLRDVRLRYDKRRGHGGGGEGDASSSSSSPSSSSGGDSNPVKTLAMRAGSYFEVGAGTGRGGGARRAGLGQLSHASIIRH